MSIICETASTPASSTSWQQQVKEAIRDPLQLCRELQLPAAYWQAAVRAAGDFSVFAPLGYVAKMQRGNPHDPLLRQVLPLAEELESVPGFTSDPVLEAQASLRPGLLQKYAGRVLLVTTGACAVHCRYCFRRHFPYAEAPHSFAAWEPALQQIAEDRRVEEVLLSGGDPLTLVDTRLAELAHRIAAIEHVKRLRIHTRLPIVIPERITAELLGWLRATRLVPYFVVHANHPRELDQAVLDCLTRLIEAGIVVLNQAVLLRGVNDDADVLQSLCLKLIDHRILPYYLHQLDRVRGAAHFEVPVSRGRKLVEQLRARLPGYAVPRYVIERAGATSKTVLS